MDMESVKLMHRIILEAFADRTVLAIAHQLSTIMEFNQVIVMEQGRVAEIGVPKELMKDENSLFRKLVETGRDGEEEEFH
jgi:ATP-binding cassette subfamily C (CFTR/MRP) protein 1